MGGESPLFARIQSYFGRQGLMATLGARLDAVEPGRVVIGLPNAERLSQENGFLHAGAATSVVDSACGYAALTMTEPGTRVLSVEFTVNLLRPAVGDVFIAEGRTVRAGRKLTVGTGTLTADGDPEPLVLMQATIINLPAED
jgi:uncharacterized protein (TIGR00369 family)